MTASAYSPSRKALSEARRPLTGLTPLVWFLAMFGIVFAVNGYLVYAAVTTHTGVVAQEPYRKGLAYNERIAADERQADLGWRSTVTLDRSGRAVVTFTDQTGAPLGGLAVEATLSRPATARYDRQVAFVETAPGRYEVDAAPVDGGAWVVTVAARASGSAEVVYRARNRTWLTP